MEIDKKQVVNWLKLYLVEEEVDDVLSQFGINKVISGGIQTLIIKGEYLEDYLRKDLSYYLKRIVSIEEFQRLKEWGM